MQPRPSPALAPGVADWIATRSSHASDWPVQRLVAAKRQTVSVVIPARNEESTVAAIVGEIRRELMDRHHLVDELIVIDSHSSDRTAAVARAAGATVIDQDDVLPALPPLAGKGDALWKGLAASTGEVVVFVDADLVGFSAEFVTGLLGPVLTDPSVHFVKAFYHRPLQADGTSVADAGGRVTELVARPLLNLHWPELAGMVQPLAGEYAGRRECLEQIPFAAGYGVEIGMLVDLVELVGLPGLAQVDLGRRQHRHHGNEVLGQMAAQLMLTVSHRLQRYGRVVVTEDPATVLAQYRSTGPGGNGSGIDRELVLTELAVPERPPLAKLRNPIATPSE